MNQSQKIRESLNNEFIIFDKYFQEAVKSTNRRLTEIIEHLRKGNGKMIRPILVFMTSKALGNITDATYHAAVTVELLHIATLIHDDVIDESDTRRGQPSIKALFNNQRSVLAGDFFLSSALAESVKTNSLEVTAIIADLGRKMSEGEFAQYFLVKEIIVDEQEYFDVIKNKTASFLAGCAKIGALTAAADRELVDNFEKMGQLLGIAFQIRDDILDYYKVDIGKPTGNDIREGKITLPLIYALKNGPKQASDEIRKIINERNYTEENIEKAVEFAKTNGGIEYAYKKIDEFLEEATSIIDKSPLQADMIYVFHMLLTYIKERKI